VLFMICGALAFVAVPHIIHAMKTVMELPGNTRGF